MGTQDDGAGEGSAPASDPKKDALYESRPTSKKIIRVVTVIAYMVSVSFVAIVLSAYYVFLWQPPNPRLMHRAHLRADPQIEYLVDKPPTEVALNETLSPNDIRDKVNLFREEILRNRGVNVSFRSSSLEEKEGNFSNVTRVDRNDSRIPESSWSPIVRALLATTEPPATTQIALGNSTDVYESLDVAAKSSTVAGSLETSAVFMKTREINESFSADVENDSLSASSSSTASSLPAESTEGDVELRKNFTAFVAGDTRSTADDRGIWEKFGSAATDSSIDGTGRTRPAGSFGSGAVDLDRVGSSGSDQHVAASTTINTSGTAEKNANSGPLGYSSGSEISQRPDGTTAASVPRPDGRSTTLEFTANPDSLGSRIARISVKSASNSSEPLDKLRTSFPPDDLAPIEIVPDPAGDEEEILESPASMVPAVVQPDPDSIRMKQESNDRITQDGDFGFV